MKYIILIAFLSGCSALPMDGKMLGALKREPEDTCNCEVQVTCH